MKELIYKGSTKDIFHISGEELCFKFTDRYSIFDYGEMPDQITNKGINTAKFTASIFKKFEQNLGIKTHLLKSGDSPDEIIVKKFNVPRDFDSSVYYAKRPINSFIPLEVIFRFGVPVGSSLLKRGHQTGEKFSAPMIEFTTKLESIDRLIDYKEAQVISGLNDLEMEKLNIMATNLAYELKNLIESKGLTLWDGKFEFAFGENLSSSEREIILVDSISLDEMRISYQDVPLSKEILRQIYKNDQWYGELEAAKKLDQNNFREKIPAPKHLNQKTISIVSEIYREVQSLIVAENHSTKYLDGLIKELKNEYHHLW